MRVVRRLTRRGCVGARLSDLDRCAMYFVTVRLQQVEERMWVGNGVAKRA
jgi:hypothetical protein